MPFLRAGLKNKPKPEPEEPKQEIEPVVDTETEEPLPEIEPDVVGESTESFQEIEPDVVGESTEPLPEIEPDVVGESTEPLQESEPAVDADTSGLPAEIIEAVDEHTAPQPDSGQDSQDNSSSTTTTITTDYSGENLKYDFTSGERYVDKVSTKTEFDKMLDELADISKDLLSWQVEKFAKQHTGKFQGDFDKAESDAKKYEAFLGGYITNAAMTLYDNGYRDIAIKQLEQAKSILEARKKLEEETEATRTRVAENDDAVDLTDILGLFGD